MKVLLGIAASILTFWFMATTAIPGAPRATPCSEEWFADLDQRYFDVSDGEGHGPDPGSSEWIGAVEAMARLPVEDRLSIQRRCDLIQAQLVRETFIVNRQLGLVYSF